MTNNLNDLLLQKSQIFVCYQFTISCNLSFQNDIRDNFKHNYQVGVIYTDFQNGLIAFDLLLLIGARRI